MCRFEVGQNILTFNSLKRLYLLVSKAAPNPFKGTKDEVFKPDMTKDNLENPYSGGNFVNFITL